jgi:colicin import membrane protein
VTSYSQTLNLSAGGLSLLVHVLFALALVFGVTWRTQPVGPAIAYLWDALPPMPEMAPPAPKLPEPLVEAKPAVAPKAPPKIVEPPKPDIALEEVARKRKAEAEALEEQRRLEALRREEERRKDEEKRKLEEKRQLDEKRRQEDRQRQEEQRRQETQRELEEEQKALEVKRQRQREEARQQMDRELARQMAEELYAERNQMRLQAEAVARGKLVLDYQDRIRLKIRGLLRLPPLPKGNIEVVFRVGLLPNGEVNGRPVLVKPSGVPAYDSAVERAIVSASPLPLPSDKEAAELFGEGLELKFRPHED